MFKRLQKRVRKQFKRQQKQVETLSQTAEKGIERNVFKRFSRLRPVRRFIFGWVGLFLLLAGCLIAQNQQLGAYYQRLQPVAGGIYNEGVIGSVSNVNPIYASSDVDRSLSKLLFSGLLSYDENNNLVGHLAESYSVDTTSRIYTVVLKQGLTWHDGKSLNADDVVYTYQTIQDPDAQSPLLSSWQGIKVAATNDRTVTFTLPSPLASFPYNLTNGILPKHVLGSVKPINMRSAEFNTMSPIGSGPFTWHGLQVIGNDPSDAEEQVALLPFDGYTAGKPKLNEFILHSYASSDKLVSAFESGQLNAAAGLQAVPNKKPASTQVHSLLLTAGTYTFFKTTSGVLADAKVRQALVAASSPTDIINSLGFMTRPVTEPLLAGQLAFNKAYAQKTNDVTAAKALLAQAGWQPGTDGRLVKDGQPLTFNFVAADTPEYRTVTTQLRKQWEAIGVKPSIQLVSAADYATIFAGHDYDATLYGVSIGEDPDVYAYWDGSQADVRSANRLNLSEWKNATADAGLEAGRTRLDPQLRAIKYAPFLQAWQQDSPALGLYQPRYLYLTRGSLYGLPTNSINNGVNRFNNVQNWQIRTAKVTQ